MAGTRTENMHQVFVPATAHCIKLIGSVPLKAAKQNFTLYKLITLPEHITSDKFVKYLWITHIRE